MKTQLLITLSILYATYSFAQFGAQQIISTNTIKPYLSLPFDIDNDDYTDVLTASGETFKLSWYRNLDGTGNFGDEIIINETPVYYLSVDFVDIDGDGDNDILYLKNNPRQLAWFENLDGFGSFSEPKIISQQDFLSAIIHKDFDNDGDKDIIAIYNTNIRGRIIWFENMDGQGTFSGDNWLIENPLSFSKILLEDLDGDGMLDILATEVVLNRDSIFWYKNLGNDNFGDAQLIYQFEYLLSGGTNIVDFRYIDINTDEKKDLVITGDKDTGLNTYWLENLDNLGNFGSIQLIDDLGFSYSFYDLDNDLDILLWRGNSILWKKNEDGLGSFGIPKTITNQTLAVRDAKAIDIDGDGWPDITSASMQDNKLAWYKNNFLGIPTNEINKTLIFPNPTNGLLHIASKHPIAEISIFNVLGQLIETTSENNQIDLSNIDSGIYFINIEGVNGSIQTFKIVKQ